MYLGSAVQLAVAPRWQRC